MSLAKEIMWSDPSTGGPLAPAKLIRLQGINPNAFYRFNSLQCSYLLCATLLVLVTTALVALLSNCMRAEVLDNDAKLTSQLIAGILQAQSNPADLRVHVPANQRPDERANLRKVGAGAALEEAAVMQSYDALRYLPGAQLVNIVEQNGKISWSTNPLLIGTHELKNEKVDAAFALRDLEAKSYLLKEPIADNESFLPTSQRVHVESYVPLADSQGSVVAVAKVFKDPAGLLGTIRRGNLVIWTSVGTAAVLLSLVLLFIIRHTDAVLRVQRQRVLEMDSLCVIGEMAAAVAHGIRNPLASIRSCAELSLDGDMDDARKSAGNIIDQVDRLGLWVRELLMFSRPQAELSENINLVALAEETLQCFRTQLEQNRVSCKFVLPKQGLQLVKGNFALVSHTLAVIISNAIEAMPGGGKLSLELQQLEMSEGVRLLVEDTGAGMLPAELEQLFKPYFTTKKNGLGLGMALAKRIMERCGGGIDVYSQKGVGTRVGLMFKAD